MFVIHVSFINIALSLFTCFMLVDESKTHLFLSPFFKNIFGLKVQFDAKLWSFYPNLLF